jgi:ParB family chromosome partitioning protein
VRLGDRAPVAIVESVDVSAVREINALEERIFRHEEHADADLWEQARLVVALLDTGLSQRELARQWINPRTGEPYSQMHVSYVKQVVEKCTFQTPRPRFREIYAALSNKPGNRFVHNSGDFEWYTPRDYIEAARSVMGEIDLDPASNDEANAIVQARRYYSVDDDGLAHDWHGRVWLNPPYVNAMVTQFSEKLAANVRAGRVTEAMVLVNNCTETRWFCTLFAIAAAICFPSGRVHFWKPRQPTTDAPLQGQAVIYVGPHVPQFCRAFHPFGHVVLVVAEP